MSWIYLAWRNLGLKKLQTTLSLILLAFGVGMVSLLMLSERQLSDTFDRNIQDIDPENKTVSTAGGGIVGWILVTAALGYAFTQMKDKPATGGRTSAPAKRKTPTKKAKA